jgi:hypothetical protein
VVFGVEICYLGLGVRPELLTPIVLEHRRDDCGLLAISNGLHLYFLPRLQQFQLPHLLILPGLKLLLRLHLLQHELLHTLHQVPA